MSQFTVEKAPASVPTSTILSSAQIPDYIDTLIALHLDLWSALAIAIQNGWGDSPQIGSDKRDALAGAISDLFAQNQLRDVDDLEEVLELYMIDEFGVGIDDGSVEEIARAIWKGREKILKGDGSGVKNLVAVWEERKKKGGDKVICAVQQGGDDDSNEEDEDGDEWNGFEDNNGDAMDVDMDDAPALIDTSKEKKRIEPEIDEDGFTKVVGKKKR